VRDTADLTDIERVEILRGPQSTLFGRNASAGVINVVTRGPTDEFESSVELTLTDDEQEKISACCSPVLSYVEDVSSLSAFGQVTWNLGSKSRLTLGGRYQYEKIEFDITDIDFYGGGPDIKADYDDDDTVTMGSIAYQYDVSDDAMMFVRYARGHKG
jgi:outer membrane receptor protein involved in Fe transport